MIDCCEEVRSANGSISVVATEDGAFDVRVRLNSRPRRLAIRAATVAVWAFVPLFWGVVLFALRHVIGGRP